MICFVAHSHAVVIVTVATNRFDVYRSVIRAEKNLTKWKTSQNKNPNVKILGKIKSMKWKRRSRVVVEKKNLVCVQQTQERKEWKVIISDKKELCINFHSIVITNRKHIDCDWVIVKFGGHHVHKIRWSAWKIFGNWNEIVQNTHS